LAAMRVPNASGGRNAGLLGTRHSLDKQPADLFREGGTFHILVISGMHITIVGALLMFVMRRATKRRWVQFGVTVGFVWAYTLAVGAAGPGTRAAAMFTAFAFAIAIYRKADLLNLFGATCLLLLVWRPSDLFGPSFQLTIVSVFAIVTIAVPLLDKLRSIGEWTPSSEQPFPPRVSMLTKSFCETLYWNPTIWKIDGKRNIWSAGVRKTAFFGGVLGGSMQRILRYTFEAVVVSLTVQTAMLPLSALYFHRIAFSSVINNLWVGPLLAVETCLVIVAATLGSVADVLGRPFFLAADAIDSLMLSLPRFTAYLSPSTRIPDLSYGYVLYVVFGTGVLILAFAALRWAPFLKLGQVRFRFDRLVLPSLIAMVLLVVLVVVHPFSVQTHDRKLHVSFLDVGQGDSIFIVFPNGKTMLVDGGGRFDYNKNNSFERDSRSIGESVVSEFLWSEGRSRIDYVVATHADADHVQGLEDVVNNFDVGNAIFGRASPTDTELDALISALQRRNVPLERLSRGDTFNIGEVRVEIVSPVGAEVAGAASDNDQSLVMRLVYGKQSFLLTGDIEAGAERRMLASGTISSTVVKAPHHGSKTSSTAGFVAAVNARYAVVSAGRRSQFGHPHKEVVGRWRGAGAALLNTAVNGTITFVSDGRTLEVRTIR
ncbi:MAG TPA: ComEC/Rec2 family competence protein, partial [Pyrinomonadaceae bacterium]|nr:ComEC/Rec2 family competence protein [Pyrinomonadaceae bacterium]